MCDSIHLQFPGKPNQANEDEFDTIIFHDISQTLVPYDSYTAMKQFTRLYFRNVSSFYTKPMLYIPEDFQIADQHEELLIEIFLSKVIDMKEMDMDYLETDKYRPECMFEPYGPYLVLKECTTGQMYVIPALIHYIPA